MPAAASPGGRVRPATPADAHEIAALHVATWRHAYAGILRGDVLGALDVGEWADRWRGRLAARAGGSLVLVFEQGGELCGFVSGGPSRDGDGGGEVYAIYVGPAGQGQGAGTRLLDAAVLRLAEARFTGASLWVLAANDRARRFYESRGWRGDGTEKPFTNGGGESVTEVRYVRRLALA